MYFWTFKDILNRVKVNKTELVTLLQRLEEMGVVQVSPGNQFKLTISKKFSWIPDGPIMRMTRRESADYFAYSFEEPIDLINSFSVYLTPASHDKLKSQLMKITKDINWPCYKKQHCRLTKKFRFHCAWLHALGCPIFCKARCALPPSKGKSGLLNVSVN